MNPVLYYLLQVIGASALLYLYYHLALRNKKFHQYNRFYLLGAMLLSVLIPFLNIPVYFTTQETHTSIVLRTLTVISGPAVDEGTVVLPVQQIKHPTFTTTGIFYYIYIFLAVLILIKIIGSLFRIRKIILNYPAEKIGGIKFINTSEPGTPFSFFRWLFWHKDISVKSPAGERIFRHEFFHIREKHTLDILFTELLTVIFWINPFFHLVKKEIRAIHEFLADQYAVQETNKWDYAELLLMQTLQTRYSLVNPFFYNQIKRRIAMITNPKKTSHQYLRQLLVLPIAGIVVTLFAFKYSNSAPDPVKRLADPITVVIDAGHGGDDPGVQSPDNTYKESVIALELAKMVQELAPSYNIKVVMTREDDNYPENALSKNDGLRKRVEITGKANPDVFVSLHMNRSTSGRDFQVEHSGIEAYVAGKRADEEGRVLASSILHELSPVYKTSNTWRSRETNGIWVLDHNICPTVLLECGYLDNRNDLAFIIVKANQEKIARSILQGIVNYKTNSSRTVTVESDIFPFFNKKKKEGC